MGEGVQVTHRGLANHGLDLDRVLVTHAYGFTEATGSLLRAWRPGEHSDRAGPADGYLNQPALTAVTGASDSFDREQAGE